MKIISRYWLLFIFLFTSTNSIYSQDRKNYELLWEIKHKDGIRKSYLFGTLHLKDARAFKFSDSVIPAIKRSEMFALEIHPDSAVNSFTENYYDVSRENIYEKILSREEYKKLKDRFFEVNKIDLDSFPMKHPGLIESMLDHKEERTDDRRTFLDAYLYGIAYNFQKEITGLEKVEDQMPAVENMSDMELRDGVLSILDNNDFQKYDRYDKITQLYYEGDLDKILDYVEGSSIDNESMTRRNNIMLNSLEKIMEDKTIFAAVGAAHLPGDQGLLTLLKQKGYEVTKVAATFSDNEKQYDIAPNMQKWFLDKNEFLGYSVLTPTKPASVPINESVIAMTSTDLIYGGTFIYMTADLRNQVLKEDFDFVNSIIKTQTQGDTDSIISRKTFQKDSIEFTEVLIKKKENYTRLQVVFNNKTVYSFMTESTLGEITSAYVDAFFDSIKIFTPKIEPAVWQTYTDAVGAYSIDIPEKILDRSQTRENPNGEDESPYLINIFSSEDKAENILYVFRYNDQPLGYYLDQKKDYYKYFVDYFKDAGTLLGEPQTVTLDGNEGKTYELMFSDKYHTIAKLFLRGNRTYLLMAQKMKEGEKISDEDKFLSSFKFLPYEQAAFDTIVNIQDKYSFKAPSKKVLVNEEPQEAFSEFSYVKNYSLLDLTTAGTYLVQHIKLKPYYRKKSIEEFYDEYVEVLTDYNDTIVSNTQTTIAGKPARDIKMSNSNTHVKQRMKLLLNDDSIFLLLTYLGDEEIDLPRVDEFFNSFEIKKKSNNFNLTASKADLIFRNLKSKDSIKVAEAEGAISYYEFDASEYKLLEKNLKYNFKDDSLYYGAKYYIINALANLEKPETLQTFSNFYRNEKNSYESRVEILEQLPKLKNTNAQATYFDLLQNHKLKRIPEKSYDIMSSLTDTIPFFVSNDAQFAKLVDTADYRPEIASIYSYNVVNDSIYADKMPLLKNKLLSYMYNDVALYVDSTSRKKHNYISSGLVYSYLEFSKGFDNPSPDVVNTLKLVYEGVKDDKWLQAQALITAIELDINIDPTVLNGSFKDMYVRFELMESLVINKKTNLIPDEYLEPQEFAKLSLYNSVGDDYDGYPKVFSLLGELTVDEKKYYVFIFSNSDEDADDDAEDSYIGIVEKTEVDFSNFEMANSYTDWEQPTDDWKTQARESIEERNKIVDSELE